jgi:hypothetical protein
VSRVETSSAEARLFKHAYCLLRRKIIGKFFISLCNVNEALPLQIADVPIRLLGMLSLKIVIDILVASQIHWHFFLHLTLPLPSIFSKSVACCRHFES